MQRVDAERSLDESTRALYERAIAEQWHVTLDVPWDLMPLDVLSEPIRHAMGATYAHIYFAESYGLGLCGRLVDVAPQGSLRQFASTQVMDEARHVHFFGRALASLGVEPVAPPGLQILERELSDVRDPINLLVHAQVVENAAQAFFVEAAQRSRSLLRAAIRLPGSEGVDRLLQCIIKFVGRDEARHIAFGQRYLAMLLADIDRVEHARLERQAACWCRIFHESFAELRPHVTRLGLGADEVLAQVWRVQRKQFRRLGLEIGESSHAVGGFATAARDSVREPTSGGAR